MDVGKVEGLAIDGDHVDIKFGIGTNSIGTESRMAIRTDTLLGKEGPRDRGTRQPAAEARGHPADWVKAPLLIRSTTRSSTSPRPPPGWNIDTVKQSLHVLSETIDQTYPHLSQALDGVARFSGHDRQTRAKRSSICSPRPTRWPASSGTAVNRSTGCWST